MAQPLCIFTWGPYIGQAVGLITDPALYALCIAGPPAPVSLPFKVNNFTLKLGVHDVISGYINKLNKVK